MTLARQADLAKAVIEGRANPRNKEERAFIAELNALSDEDRFEKMEDLEYELRCELNATIYEGFDVDKLLAGESPWPDE